MKRLVRLSLWLLALGILMIVAAVVCLSVILA